jgi:hypothetical protein
MISPGFVGETSRGAACVRGAGEAMHRLRGPVVAVAAGSGCSPLSARRSSLSAGASRSAARQALRSRGWGEPSPRTYRPDYKLLSLPSSGCLGCKFPCLLGLRSSGLGAKRVSLRVRTVFIGRCIRPKQGPWIRQRWSVGRGCRLLRLGRSLALPLAHGDLKAAGPPDKSDDPAINPNHPGRRFTGSSYPSALPARPGSNLRNDRRIDRRRMHRRRQVQWVD